MQFPDNTLTDNFQTDNFRPDFGNKIPLRRYSDVCEYCREKLCADEPFGVYMLFTDKDLNYVDEYFVPDSDDRECRVLVDCSLRPVIERMSKNHSIVGIILARLAHENEVLAANSWNVAATRRIGETLFYVGIQLVDYVAISKTCSYSMRSAEILEDIWSS
jgi:DNA repair protein RadC